jgi:hypothetical protein
MCPEQFGAMGMPMPGPPPNLAPATRKADDASPDLTTADLERGGEPMCPALYRVWARNDRGEFSSVAEIDAN